MTEQNEFEVNDNTYSIINNPLLQDGTVIRQAIDSIQDTLSTLGAYTPAEVDTFSDWSYDAGDIVTLVKDGADYIMPIFQNVLNWNGASDITWQSSGNEERELPTVQERQSYGTGTAVAAVEDDIATTYAELQKTDTKVSLVVGTIDGENYIKAGEIAAEINATTGESTAWIHANHIDLNGDSIVITGETAAYALHSEEMSCTYFYQMSDGNGNGDFGVDSEAHFYNNVYLAEDGGTVIVGDGDGSGTITGPLASFTTVRFEAGQNNYDLTVSNVPGLVTDLQLLGPTNNQFTLQKKTVGVNSWTDVGTFSRATELGGQWGSGTGVLTVTATPQGNTYVSNHYLSFDGDGQHTDFSVKMRSQDTGQQNPSERMSMYGYLVAAGSGATAYVYVGPNNSTTGAVGRYPLYLHLDNDYAYISKSSSSTSAADVVAKLANTTGASVSIDSVEGVEITEPTYPTEEDIGGFVVTASAGMSVATQTFYDLYMTKGSWTNGHQAVNVRYGDSTGPLLSRVWVDSSYSFSPANSTNTAESYNRNYSLSTAYRYHYITINICGETYKLQIQIS